MHDPAQFDQGLRRDRATGHLELYGKLEGTYSVVVAGCRDFQGIAQDVSWYFVAWDASVPPGATLTVSARSADAMDRADPAWATATPTSAGSAPLDLQATLTPNVLDQYFGQIVHDAYLRVDFDFKTADPSVGPTLQWVDVSAKCCGLCGD